MLKVSLFAGNIVLYWPTNAAGFLLEAAPNLINGIWTGVSPSLAAFGTNNFVTNTADTTQRFFRLRKPECLTEIAVFSTRFARRLADGMNQPALDGELSFG